MRGKTQALDIRPNPRKIREDLGIFKAWFSRLVTEITGAQHEQIQATKSLATLPCPRDSDFEPSAKIGQQGDDAVGLSHIHLAKHNPVQRPSHATEITK